MIPKRIYTVWLSDDGSMPDLVKKCVASQKLPGYEHHLITLDNCFKGSKYIQECLASNHRPGIKYCKASDYLRMHYLEAFGGIYLDADVEILPGKNFDDLLFDRMFVGLEKNDWGEGRVVLGTAVIGAEAHHPLIQRWMDEVEMRFRGDTDDCYESSMEQLNILGVSYQDTMRLYSPDYFYPYDNLLGTTTMTENTRAIHHFTRAWTPESILDTFRENIEKGVNFAFVKRGDGELACMNNEPGGNCDGHPYSKELGDRLRDAYAYLKDKATIVDFDKQAEYNVLLHRTDSDLRRVTAFYKAIQNSNRPKLLVGPPKLYKIAKLLDAEHLMVPEVDAFSWYTADKRDLLSRLTYEHSIVMFCAGMPAKAMISDLIRSQPSATYLDCGSAFDPSVSQTRTYQITPERFWELYE